MGGIMMYDYETSRNNLQELITWYDKSSGDRNEATTRLQLVDKLFFDCLGWSKDDDVIVEEPHGNEYADYVFSTVRKVLIVEAKREGDYFELPAGKVQLEYSLPVLCQNNRNLKAALGQVAGYCQDRGVPLGAVSNGHQIVAFIAARNDGQAPLDARALVFPSLRFMLDHFLDLWQALSRPGVEEKKLQTRLSGGIITPLPAKLSSRIMGYPGSKGRNAFQNDLFIVSDLVIEDLSRTRDLEKAFLEECYSQSGALSQYSLIARELLQARYAALFDTSVPKPLGVPVVDKKGVSADLLAESLTRRPILLIGDVGVGKTMFLRHMIKVEAPSVFANAITLYIDLGSQAALSVDLRLFILLEIERQLRDDYQIDVHEAGFVRGVHNLDVERFRNGIYGRLRESNPQLYLEKEIEYLAGKVNNVEGHLKQSLYHISRGRQKQVVICLDNADQRDDNTQQQSFIIAQEFAGSWEAAVFVALRPETYHKSLRSGALSGYHPKAFTIAPPRIDDVLHKRLAFALRLTSGEIPIKTLSEQTQVRLTTLEKVIRVFIGSLYRNDSLLECIDNIAGGNARLALNIVKGFFGSGHIDTERMVRTFDQEKEYITPLHELLRAIIFQDAEYYDPTRSYVANIFDVSTHDPKEHFLLGALIGVLTTVHGNGGDDGFVDTQLVYDHLQAVGYTPEQIDTAVGRAYEKKLIETTTRHTSEGSQMPEALRATSIGVYHIARLCHMFVYLDAVVIDTPIFDAEVRGTIREVERIPDPVERLEARLERAELFVKYLDNQWKMLTASVLGFDWHDASLDVRADLRIVEDSANRRIRARGSRRHNVSRWNR
jgi:hypothetical protein